MTKLDNWTDPQCASIVRLLSSRLGLSFRADDRDRVELGIHTAMHRSSKSDLLEYRRLLEQDPDVWDDLVVELTIGETYFFRESGHFSFLRDEVLPDLLRRRGPDHTIRIWSAGCASGEEAYSLAILLEQEGLRERSHVLATDVSTAALAKAREAAYPDWSLRGQGASLAKPFLTRRGEMNVLDERIRDQVDFQVLNLAVDSYPSINSGTRNLDIIMCRNVLIYFDLETVRSIAQRFHASLAEGGWLITASGDPHLGEIAAFETVVRTAGVYYRRATEPASLTGRPTAFQIQTSSTSVSADRSEERLGVANEEEEPGKANSELRVKPDAIIRPELANRPNNDWLVNARQSLADGRYMEAIELTSRQELGHDAWQVRVQALANVDLTRAELACAKAATQHPLSAHLHYLHALLLLEQNRGAESVQAARRVIYLDRSLVAAHLLLGSILRQLGDLAGALRAFRNAHDLSVSRPMDEVVPFTDGETAGQLACAAKSQMDYLQGVNGGAG